MNLIYKNILVAVDGSKEAEWAFQKAIDVVKRNDAELSLVHVIDTRSYATIESYDQTVTDKAIHYAQDLLQKYEDTAKASDITKVATFIEYGSPKAVIPKDVAKKVTADLIICGATGLNTMERLLIGSVSEHITRSATCDVLVVRTEEKKD